MLRSLKSVVHSQKESTGRGYTFKTGTWARVVGAYVFIYTQKLLPKLLPRDTTGLVSMMSILGIYVLTFGQVATVCLGVGFLLG